MELKLGVEKMEREKGFEPSTFAMATRRSSQLSYSRKNELYRYYFMQGLSRVKGSWLRYLNPFSWRAQKTTSRILITGSSKEPLLSVEPLIDPQVIDEVFGRIQQAITRQIAKPYGHNAAEVRLWPRWSFESGRIYPGQRYFFAKPHGQRGFLFEQTGAGWLISKSEKIVDRDLFLRSYEVWDLVCLYRAGKTFRAESSRHGSGAMSLTLYERRLIDAISAEVIDSLGGAT